ncbi:hypothetical protein T12_2014 [Trichinella patagoniensis]|uniref:Uncharacterized protein n=1 Tax=Trichinella patagoniensis TaxID=990121 RepID=A0A0V0YJ40_9BILA|nr:hypothetical protein T12_2014 [Trichinella patagoniensis]
MPQPSMLQFYVYFYIFVEVSSASSQLGSTYDFARGPPILPRSTPAPTLPFLLARQAIVLSHKEHGKNS